ncbi:MAG: type II toxin-antitoxin system RelE/ParE family toxin [Pacificimonas sp.]
MTPKLSPEAIADLNEIRNYTQEKWGEAQADIYERKLIARIDWLCANRPLWRRDEQGDDIFKWREIQRVIFHRQAGQECEVVRIRHVRRSNHRLLSE